jgi:hypothetical protein
MPRQPARGIACCGPGASAARLHGAVDPKRQADVAGAVRGMRPPCPPAWSLVQRLQRPVHLGPDRPDRHPLQRVKGPGRTTSALKAAKGARCTSNRAVSLPRVRAFHRVAQAVRLARDLGPDLLGSGFPRPSLRASVRFWTRDRDEATEDRRSAVPLDLILRQIHDVREAYLFSCTVMCRG